MKNRNYSFSEILEKLNNLSDPSRIIGMTKYGIKPKKLLGISIPKLRQLANEIGINHSLSLNLWKTEIHEAKMLASMIDNITEVTKKQMENWVLDFDSWDVCDQVCSNLFEKTQYSVEKAIEWSDRKEEFVKRAGFVLMARIAVSNKKAENVLFDNFFPLIIKEAVDERNYVKKAVNWALRQIGKRNILLNDKAIQVAETISKISSKTSTWIATDALRELRSNAVQQRLLKKHKKLEKK